MINDNIYNHLEQACQYLSRLKLDDCLKEIETYLTEIEHKQKAYTIGIRAAQISEDSIKLLSLIERGLLKIQGDRILFLETSYEACKQMALSEKCIELAGKCKNQGWRLVNGFAYSNPKNSLKLFFTEIMENIFYNIEHQISNNVYQVTGPAAWQKVYDKYRVNLKSENIQCQCVTYPTDIYQVFRPALNKRPSMRGHWSKVQEKQSIYNNNSKNQ